MSGRNTLSEEEQKELLRRCWNSHDAHWFMTVAEEYGIDAANRLNRRALRGLGRSEMLRLGRALGVGELSSLTELLEIFEVAGQIFGPPPRAEVEMRAVDERSYEVWFRRCIAHENIVRAGTAESYICAVFDRFQGWHDALNLPLAEEPPALPCAKTLGKECRRLLTIR